MTMTTSEASNKIIFEMAIEIAKKLAPFARGINGEEALTVYAQALEEAYQERVKRLESNKQIRKCMMCKKSLNNPLDALSGDCGGHCVLCMAECDDTDCINSVVRVYDSGGAIRPVDRERVKNVVSIWLNTGSD